MKVIKISNKFGDYEALVDDEDYEVLSYYRWHIHYNKDKTLTYARHNTVGRMHRCILEMHGYNVEDKFIDHIDGNGLNNQKSNLRVVNNATNTRNNHKVRDGKFIGVGYRQHAGRWIAKIKAQGRDISLGYFDTPEEAAYAYDMAAILYFEEIDVLNFPENFSEYMERIENKDFPFNQKRKTRKNSPTEYRGVFIKSPGKFGSKISFYGKGIHLGYFHSEEQAARVYDLAFYVKNEGIDNQLMNFPDNFFEFYSDDDINDMLSFLKSKGIEFNY